MAAARAATWLLLALALLCAALPAARASNAEGLAFLEANKGKPGVVTLPSGLQYKVLRAGTGRHHPTADSQCSTHYHGTLINGEVFDSSVDRGSPTDFAPNQVIKAWTEALQLMVEGDKWQLYSPSELAYGSRGAGGKIGPDTVLIFDVELIKIKGDKVDAKPRCDAASLAGCSDKEKDYIAKVKKEGGSHLKEIARLSGMISGKMKPELVQWIQQRVSILQQLNSGAGEKTEL